MLKHEGKSLEEMTLEDTIEFEKVLLKRSLSTGMMSENVQHQIQMFLEQVRMHKAEKVGELQSNSLANKEKIDEPLQIGEIDEIEQESSDDTE